MLASGMLILQNEVPSVMRRTHPMRLLRASIWRENWPMNCIILKKTGIYHQPGRLR